ncbi:MAG: 2-oxoacid:acceptor oxidoreductase family protein [Candidatus Methanofastidiosia archaeon]
MRKEIRIAGSGGQGIILAGVVLGKAASVFDSKIASHTQSYGPEARGGASKSEVIISDEDINYPFITMADVLVTLSQQAYDKYRQEVKKEGITLIDTDLVLSHNNRSIEIPAMRTAISLGSKLVANMVMLGALIKFTNVVALDSLKKSVKNTVPGRFCELDMKAIDGGLKLAEKIESDRAIKTGNAIPGPRTT